MTYRLYIFLLLIMAISCKSPEARQPIEKKSGSFMKESAERNIELNKAESEKILNVLSTLPDSAYQNSESGFWYRYINKVQKDTIRPEFGDLVLYNMSIRDIDSTLIYSEQELGDRRYLMDKEELFTGLREGLKLMKPLETVIFYFPSQKAYGYYGDERKIGTNRPLICKVTLNSIIKNETD